MTQGARVGAPSKRAAWAARRRPTGRLTTGSPSLGHFSDGADAPNPAPALAGARCPAPLRGGAPCVPSDPHVKNASAGYRSRWGRHFASH